MATPHSLTSTAKTQVPSYADDGLRAKAHAVGCQTAEYLRDIIFMDLYGQTFGEHVANDRKSVMGCQAHKKADGSADK
jgi:hypothetical protein